MSVPRDDAAERAVVGICLNTRHGIGHVDLTPEDFHSATMANLYAAALAMPDVVTLEERVAFAVEYTGYDEGVVRRLIADSPVMFDASTWAVRVAECARRRAAMTACVDAYEALRDGADIDEAMAWAL